MNPLALKTLEERIGQRSPLMERLLKRLEQDDPLFAYNVPATIRTTSNEQELQAYVDKVYGTDTIEIIEPEEIAKYAQPGHVVMKRGEYKELNWRVEKDEEGIVRKIEGGMLHVDFGKYKGVTMKISDELLKVGCPNLLCNHPYQWSESSVLTASDHPHKKMKVKYIGEPIESVKSRVPHGTIGIIAWQKPEGYAIVWKRNENVQCAFAPTYNYGWQPQKYFTPQEFKLYVPNKINIPALVKEIENQRLQEMEG